MEFLALNVLVAELSHEVNRVHTGILGKSVGNQLKSLTIHADTVSVSSENGASMLLELLGDFHFNCGTTWDEGSLLNEGTNDTEGVMEGSICLI